MNRSKVLALALAAGSGMFGHAPASADDVHCPPRLGAVSIDGNVLVAAACVLDGTTVRGNVHLYAGGSLTATNARIVGNIQAERADFVDVSGGSIGGSVQLDNLVGDVSVVENAAIGGSVQLKSNRSRIEVAGNDVGADIQAFSNSGGVLILGNVVDGNLQCKENSPLPVGGNNRVHGNKEDQCANLQPDTAGAMPAPVAANGASSLTTSTALESTTPTQGAGGGGAMGWFAALLALPLVGRAFGRRRGR